MPTIIGKVLKEDLNYHLYSTFVVCHFDITGLTLKDKVTSITAIKVVDNKEVARFNRSLNSLNRKKHFLEFIEFLQDFPLLTHSSRFMTRQINFLSKKYTGKGKKVTVIDTMPLYRSIFSFYYKHNLDYILEHTGIEKDTGNVYSTCINIFKAYLFLKDYVTYFNLFDYLQHI